ncbi:MAG: polysaccharide biosynthesis C-terminal domain-containing protein, partial [candidate division WOR-3 bacterium]
AVVFDSVILALGYIYFYTLQKERFIKWKFNFDLALKYIKIGTPLILSDVITLFIMRIDQVMIKELRDTYEVGVYAASTRLTEAWYIFAVIITNSLFPALLNAKEKSELLFKERFRNLLIFLYTVSLLLSIIIQIFSNDIVKLLFGSNFYPTADILVVQIWTSIFVFLGFASTKWLLVYNKQKQQFYRALSALITNVILNYPLIKIYGGLGAAYATLIAWFFGVYLFHLFDSMSRELFWEKTKVISGYFVIEKFRGGN